MLLLGFQTFELRIGVSGNAAVGSNTQFSFFRCRSLLCLDYYPLLYNKLFRIVFSKIKRVPA